MTEKEVVGVAKRDLQNVRELKFTLDENGDWRNEEIQLNALGQNFLNAYMRTMAKRIF